LAGPASGTFASHTARALTEAGDHAAAEQLGKGEWLVAKAGVSLGVQERR
jgi:hypothetical protein